MARGRGRLIVAALALSLLLHAALLGVPPWSVPAPGEAVPLSLEARLVTVASPVPAEKPRPAPARPSRPPDPRPLPTAVAGASAYGMPADTPPLAESVDAAPAADPPEDTPAQHDPPTQVALNPLPARLDLQYSVQYGPASGEQTLVWLHEGGRYTATSVASATGFAGLFYRGRFVQTSRGRVAAAGLVPEEFWDQRGERRSSARFDAAAGEVSVLPARGQARHFAHPGELQDVLSLFFQLALTAPPPERFAYTVFNGKKLREYAYEVRGEETLETALGPLRALHVARVGHDDGRFDAWLAIDRHFLPVRVLHSDEDGRTVELQIRAIAP